MEVNEDSKSPTAFHSVEDLCCAVPGCTGTFAVDSPARVLVPCPSAALKETPDVGAECTEGMAVGVRSNCRTKLGVNILPLPLAPLDSSRLAGRRPASPCVAKNIASSEG